MSIHLLDLKYCPPLLGDREVEAGPPSDDGSRPQRCKDLELFERTPKTLAIPDGHTLTGPTACVPACGWVRLAVFLAVYKRTEAAVEILLWATFRGATRRSITLGVCAGGDFLGDIAVTRQELTSPVGGGE